jgi:DNA-binding beta-propeller fold protein YncE
VFLVPGATSKEKPPIGIVTASAGDFVVMVDPTTGNSKSIPSGPVAWLFPAPGGILFAPDLVNGRTTVLDLRTLTPRDPIPGVTMPRFGTLTDRYLVLAEQLLVMTYPDRALLNSFEISFDHPWQVAVLADNTVLFVLERLPDAGSEASMAAVSLSEGRLVYRRPLGGDVRHFALSVTLAVMALAQAEGNQVIVVDPATLTPIAAFPTEETPVDIVFAGDGSTLVTAIERQDGGGELLIWKIKSEKKEGLKLKNEWIVPLSSAPVRLASSPDGRHVAVGLTSAELQIIELESRLLVATADLRAAPRDVVWCDPSIEGTLLPDWSDDDEPTLNLGGR